MSFGSGALKFCYTSVNSQSQNGFYAIDGREPQEIVCDFVSSFLLVSPVSLLLVEIWLKVVAIS